MDKIGKWFKKLNPTVQIAVIIGLILVVWTISKRIKGYLSALGANAELQGEKDALEGQGMQLSFPKSKYKIFADDLETAMVGLGTDTATVFSTYNQMHNDLDILELEQAFGFRSSFWQWPSPNPVDLRAWLKDDLSTSEMAQLNSILASKGISKSY